MPEWKIVNPYIAYTPTRFYEDVARIQEKYSDFISVSSIGQTACGQSIPLLTFGYGPTKLLFTGAIHPNEHITASYLMHALETYAEHYVQGQLYANRNIAEILERYTLYFVPMINPDGVSLVTEGYRFIDMATAIERYPGFTETMRRSWRRNLNNVDLNRNFPFMWADENNAGPHGGSELETQALIQLCSENEFAYLISCHASGQVLYWRDPINGEVPGDADLANRIRAITGYKLEPISLSENGLYCGGFENWFRGTFLRPAITVEFTPSKSTTLPYDNIHFDSLLWDKAYALIPALCLG